MCFPPEISVPALPAFARVRDWRGEERGSKAWRPSSVLFERAQKWSAVPDGAPLNVDADADDARSFCDGGAVNRNHVDDAAEICAAGIKLPLQAPAAAKTALDVSEQSLIPARALERRGSLPAVSGGGAIYHEPLEVVVAASSAIPQQQLHRTNEETGFAAWQEQQTFLNADLYLKSEVPILDGVEIDASLQQMSDLEIPIAKFDETPAVAEYSDLEKLESELLEGGKGLSGLLQQQLVDGETPPELENAGSLSAWFDCIAKNDPEVEEPSVIKESSSAASFDVDTKPAKKAPKLTKGGKKQKPAPAVQSHEGVDADTDDETEPVLIDEKRKRRMLSNRASAQRSRQRRQDRLDQLEVLTAQLRVENASLLRKSNLALQLARKFEGEKKRLLEKTENLTKELLEARKMGPATAKLHEECHSSPNASTTSTDVSEIAGEADFSRAVKSKPEKVQDDEKNPLQSVGSGSYVTVDDQMDTSEDTDTTEDTDMTANCNNWRPESHKAFQVSDEEDAAIMVKMASNRSPTSYKTGGNNAQVFQLPMSLPQESLLSPVEVPETDSEYLFKEICDLFDNSCNNDSDILNAMDQNWLESFAECLNA